MFIDIPLATIAALGEGDHTVYLHAKDVAGNWSDAGATAVTITVDKTAPSVTIDSITPPSVEAGTATVDLAATASETPAVAEYFIGADPGAGNGTAMTIGGTSLSATVDVSTLAVGTYTVNVRVRDAAGNWSATSSLTFDVTPPPFTGWYFSTLGNTNPTGVTGTADNSDVYSWDGAQFARVWDATANGVPGGGNVDGLKVVDATHFYLSFVADTTITGFGTVQDEDVVEYDNGVWSVYFDGTGAGLTAGAQDIDGFDIVGGILYFSTQGNTNPPGVTGTADNSDVYSWDGAQFARVWDATANGVPGGGNVDGLKVVDATHFYLSFANTNLTVTGVGTVQDEDIVEYNTGVWSVFFDGTAQGMTAGNQDLDAIDIP
jgi:hypothetical protein